MLIYFDVFVKDFFVVEIAGDRPPRYGEKTHPPHRRARACPSPCTIAGDRPPRYGVRDLFYHRRARACPSPCCGLSEDREGNPLGCACGIRGGGAIRSARRVRVRRLNFARPHRSPRHRWWHPKPFGSRPRNQPGPPHKPTRPVVARFQSDPTPA